MPWIPPIPIVTTTGRIELSGDEIEAINKWLDSHKEWLKCHQGTPRLKPTCEEVTAGVLGRLLGHALGSMSPRSE